MVLPHHEVETPVFMPVGTQVIIDVFLNWLDLLQMNIFPFKSPTGYSKRSDSRAARTIKLSNNVKQYIPPRNPSGNDNTGC